jgi:dTDP-4-dehydrorhamnose 3,5-epimerase
LLMMNPTRSTRVATPTLGLEDFKADEPFARPEIMADATHATGLIDGVSLTTLSSHSDERGSLCELLTTRDGPIEPIVHVYQVTAAGGSTRAWVYHRWQHDRLAFVNGRFKIALYDIRPGSPTFSVLNVFVLGQEQPGLLSIPPCVIHGVHNMGGETTIFINLPTRAWDPRTPDKCRLPENDPRVPFSFHD